MIFDDYNLNRGRLFLSNYVFFIRYIEPVKSPYSIFTLIITYFALSFSQEATINFNINIKCHFLFLIPFIIFLLYTQFN